MPFKQVIAIICLLLLPLTLFAEDDDPLFAGSLLAFYAQNADPGRLSVQPYFFFTHRYGIYGGDNDVAIKTNVDAYQTLLNIETGITKKLDIAVVFLNAYIRSHDQGVFHPGDMAVFLGYEIAKDNKKTSRPDLRLVVGESFPTGTYDRLNIADPFGDFSGDGSYDTYIILIGRKIFYIIPKHPFNINVNLYYIIPSGVEVNGLSVYGGGPDTFGTVAPGNQYIANVALEYLFTKNWGTAIDIRYEHQDRCGFKSFKSLATPAGLPSSERFSLAPSIEYNRDENFSVAGGVWFSVTGRNAIAFTSGVFTVFYYF